MRRRCGLTCGDALQRGFDALMCAAESGNKDVVEMLLARKAKPTNRDVNGRSCLLIAR